MSQIHQDTAAKTTPDALPASRRATAPVVIELGVDTPEQITPSNAPPVPEDSAASGGRAMAGVVALAGHRSSWLGRWFWGLLAALTSFALSLGAWNFVVTLLARNPVLGAVALGLLGLFIVVLLLIALREVLGIMRFRRLDGVHRAATAALATQDLAAARVVGARLVGLYAGRPDQAWATARFQDRAPEVLDADALLKLAEATLLAPLDAAARTEIETAARQVAAATAIVPLALADVVVALAANLRMIRRIAEIYGGRAGVLGNWRLTRMVFTHLVATGAVSVGDDLIHSIMGGGLVAKLSRRFGEGVINGALTARVGVAALEVCRPLPFMQIKRPAVTGLVKRALAGLFGAKPA